MTEAHMRKEDALWDEYLNSQKYQITNQDGKFGLNFQNSVLLEPRYSSLEITNHNIPLSDPQIRKFIVDPYYFVDEWNFPIIHADGKCGLIDGVINELVVDLEYDRIVKLTYDHYLCLQSGTYTLNHFVAGRRQVSATFCESNKINLPELINILQTHHPEAFAELSKTLCYDGNSYISEFWHYHLGICYPEFGHTQYFPIAVRKAILSTNFETTPLELVIWN
jgi:hypothetical protein